MKKLLTTLTLGALAACACAQGPEAPRLHVEDVVTLAAADLPAPRVVVDPLVVVAGRELEGERVVKGAPYCATAVHETIQPLADGNRIVRSQQSQLCRDGEGRTRREVQREGGPKVVYLNDPVAKESWVLYPEQKRAQRLRGGPGFAFDGGDAAAHAAWQASMQDWGERMKEQAARWKAWGAQVAERARSADAERVRARAAAGEPGIVIEQAWAVPPVPGASAPERRRELRVLRASDMPAPPAPPVPPMAAPVPPAPPMPPLMLTAPLLPREGGTTTALAPKDIDGIKVHGERTTWTIPAGKIGNEKPIVISREVWRSPELMLTVSSRDADPRSGEQNYRLEKLKRGEPDPALMKPPADFTEGPKRSASPSSGAAPRSS